MNFWSQANAEANASTHSTNKVTWLLIASADRGILRRSGWFNALLTQVATMLILSVGISSTGFEVLNQCAVRRLKVYGVENPYSP